MGHKQQIDELFGVTIVGIPAALRHLMQGRRLTGTPSASLLYSFAKRSNVALSPIGAACVGDLLSAQAATAMHRSNIIILYIILSPSFPRARFV